MRQHKFLVFVLAAALSGLGCTVNPATGKRQLNFVSASEEISRGEQAAPQFLKGYGGPVPSTVIQRYVRDIGLRLAAVSERPDLPWEFNTVDSEALNAFALPGGKVFITRGMLAKLNNEAQLAGVLGHEVGHVTAMHINQQITNSMLLQGVVIGLGVAGEHNDEAWLRVLGVGTQLGGTVYLLKFGRDQESQSDELGVRYMTKLGYNPVGQLQVMEVLESASKNSGGMPEFLSTHPLPSTRIERLEKHIREHYPDYSNPDAYRFDEERYRSVVLDGLKALPKAKHGG